MKFMRFLGVLWFLIPCALFAAPSSEFQNASQLLSAARRGDTQTVQILINRGANVNYVDSSGLSLVCTAVMNNDKLAIQVLQMYGADASQCDRQIKNYKQKTRVAARGEEYGFFSGLSSSHVLALSAVGVAAVIAGVALLTDAFDAKNNNGSSSSGGSHSGSGGGSGGGSGSQWTAGGTPYGPAYLNAETGEFVPNTNIAANLATWDASVTNPALRVADYNYFRPSVQPANNYSKDELVSTLQNYLLVMHGYNLFANGYMGQYTFRDETSHAPILSATRYQRQPVRVGLITGNGINPAGSADYMGDGIIYVSSTALNADPTRVDKYVNNIINTGIAGMPRTELPGFDLSGSGTVFNPFATNNESALAKIVAGWEADGRTTGDLYGFVPNGQLAVYRTGNGSVWTDLATTTNIVGSLGGGDATLSVGDTITMTTSGYEYNIVSALYPDGGEVAASTVSIGETTYKLSAGSKMFLAKCVSTSGCSTDILIYIDIDGNWYVNSTGGNDIDAVYAVNSDTNDIYVKKEKVASSFNNFQALALAVNSANALNVVAMTNVLDDSRDVYYTTIKDFAVAVNGSSNVSQAYQNTINYYYDHDNYVNNTNPVQGALANAALSSLTPADQTTSGPIIVMPAGDYLAETSVGTKYAPMDAIFENYAPLVYTGPLKHNFMTIVAVNNDGGTASSSTISGYGDGTANGQLILSQWSDSSGNSYMSRKCGLAGVGSGSVDPWCFAASGPTTEMATAAAAGAVASVKAAFPYMTNDQVFTLLALTAEGPFLKTKTDGTVLSKDTLASYLNGMYKLPTEQSFDDMTTDEYLAAFKDVFGYGLINLERAIKPGYSIFYYSQGSIVSGNDNNAYWSAAPSARSSTVLSGRGTIRTSFYDIVESIDETISLPRVWNTEVSLNSDYKRGLYMGDVLADFAVDSTNKRTNKIGNMTFDMAMSPRAYNDSFNGLDNLSVKFSSENYDLDANYQHYLTDGESRFNGRANGVLSLVSNSVSSGAKYKSGDFAFGAHAFSGTITDENLLENDPVVSAQFEPGRLGFANGGAIDLAYNKEKFNLNVSFGNMNETNTVLGSISEGLLSLNGAKTQYVDAVANYKPFEKVNLSVRATFANTQANVGDGIITELSNIKSNAFALGADFGGLSFTAAMPLAVVDGKMGYDYADLSVVENNGQYDVLINNPHTEYIDLVAPKRELRFSGSYKKSVGEFTDAGLGFVYRVNPGNTDAFGNESIFMFKLHHRLGI